jgi:threonyl-tRNA synthetase
MKKIDVYIDNFSLNLSIEEGENLFHLLNFLPTNNCEEFIGAIINENEIVDFYYIPKDKDKIKFLTIDNQESLDILNHSTSHILAYAVKSLFKDAKLGIGPSIKNGFYYDFFVEKPFTPEDLEKIENKMREILKNNYIFEKETIDKETARKLFKDEKFKLELINEIEDEYVSIYRVGEFIDLCRGPHLPNTKYIKHFKLLSSSSSYWKGDEKRDVLQRIYGTSFFDEESLNKYIERLEEIEKRDHRRLGKELDLFSIHPDEAGPGLIFYHPKGAMIRKIIEDFEREEHLKRGYQFVYTPHIFREKLWEISGHLSYYKENMFTGINIEDIQYLVKPMNCPGHILIYKSKTRSYRELPIRYFELGTVYRYEKSGVLHGLLRVRGFTQDDAHIFCTEEQLEDEIIGVLDFALYMMNVFGFKNFEIFLSTRPEKYVGTIDLWEKATEALKKALEDRKIDYKIDPGEGVFHGPKIDIKLKDSLDRLWQGPTIQVDFNLPQRFNLKYMGKDGKEYTPVMIHRVVLGSMERFFGALIENYAGNFPLWLSPVQIKIASVSKDVEDYGKLLYNKLLDNGFRVEFDFSDENLQEKIKRGELEKVPYIFVIGKKEKEKGVVSVRKKGEGNLGMFELDTIIEKLKKEVLEKK